ncbi:MAG: hypothetical protein ACW98Y_00365 [Candidatus Thorarchaeota archaeon]
MGRRGIALLSVFVLFIGCAINPIAAQSDVASTQEFILDSSMGDRVYAMILDNQNNLLLVGDRSPSVSNDSLRLEGMALKVNDQGQVSNLYVLDNNEANSITDVALDSDGNVLLAGKGGEWEGNQFGYLLKLSPQGDIIWTIEFPDIYFHDFVGIEVNLTTNDVFFAGTRSYGRDGIFLSKVNETGGIEWEQIWYQEGYLESPYTTHSLYLISQGLLLGVDMGDSSHISLFAAEKTVAFSSNGTELWTHNEEYEVLRELENGELLCAGSESTMLCDFNLDPLWQSEIELHCDYIPRINGFDVNGSGNIIAYGSVIGLGESPVKGAFSLSYTPALIPQTLIVSISKEGDIEWYDFYVAGESSIPCGASFDQLGKLVIAGYYETSSPYSAESNIWILWDFSPTPFPDVIICDAQPIFFGLLLIPVAVVLSWGLYRARKGRVSEDMVLKETIRIFRRGGLFFAVLFFVFFGVIATPFPSPANSLSFYGFFIALLFVLISYIMEYLVKYGKEEPESEPIYHYYQQQS